MPDPSIATESVARAQCTPAHLRWPIDLPYGEAAVFDREGRVHIRVEHKQVNTPSNKEMTACAMAHEFGVDITMVRLYVDGTRVFHG